MKEEKDEIMSGYGLLTGLGLNLSVLMNVFIKTKDDTHNAHLFYSLQSTPNGRMASSPNQNLGLLIFTIIRISW